MADIFSEREYAAQVQAQRPIGGAVLGGLSAKPKGVVENANERLHAIEKRLCDLQRVLDGAEAAMFGPQPEEACSGSRLYGEGLIGNIERIEERVSQIMAVASRF